MSSASVKSRKVRLGVREQRWSRKIIDEDEAMRVIRTVTIGPTYFQSIPSPCSLGEVHRSRRPPAAQGVLRVVELHPSVEMVAYLCQARQISWSRIFKLGASYASATLPFAVLIFPRPSRIVR